MRIEGKKNDYIAEALGMSKRTLVCWWCDELIVDYLHTLAQNVEREFAVQLATAGLTAVNELSRILQLGDAEEAPSFHQKLEIARDLMDRTPALAKVVDRQEVPGTSGGDTTNVLQIIGNMSNDDLASYVNGGWQRTLTSTNGDSAAD